VSAYWGVIAQGDMKSLDDIYLEICNAYETNRQQIYERFIVEASRDKGRLSELLSSIPLDDNAHLFELYEAMSLDCDEFQQCLYNELTRLMKIANEDPINSVIFNSMEAYAFVISKENTHLNTKIKNVFISGLNSREASIRRFSIWMLGDFLKLNGDVETLLFDKLKFDLDWRARIIASINLLELCPKNPAYKLSFVDKVRTVFFKNEAFNFTAL
jgi:hypothetical protein